MVKKMLKKLFIASLSTICFSFIYACFSYDPHTAEDTYHFGFIELFSSAIIYSGIIYFVAGILLSYGVDKLHKLHRYRSKRNSYFAKVGMYSIAGILVTFPLYLYETLSLHLGNMGILANIRGLIFMLLYGSYASNVFYHVELFINAIGKRLRNHTINDIEMK
ncbi:hypothetical protein ACFCYN_20605 [Gottfriedia sp. NPDC056225]|uniref:hypothetical protein n=1 Tax=Gottfriedia sp. NPDC056225 TaxID=3345751 RepID=UPI0035E20050